MNELSRNLLLIGILIMVIFLLFGSSNESMMSNNNYQNTQQEKNMYSPSLEINMNDYYPVNSESFGKLIVENVIQSESSNELSNSEPILKQSNNSTVYNNISGNLIGESTTFDVIDDQEIYMSV